MQQRAVTAASALVSLWSSAAFVLLLGALHLLRPDLDPSWRFISEYELGPHGWVMRLAFAALAVSCLSFVIAIRPDIRGVAGYFGVALVALSAAGMFLAAIYVPDALNRLHEVGAMLDNLPFGALFIAWSLWRAPAWRHARRLLAWTSWIPLAGLLLFVGSMAVMLPAHGGRPGPDVLVGWPNRIMILAHCAWLMPLAWCASRRLADEAQEGGRQTAGAGN